MYVTTYTYCMCTCTIYVHSCNASVSLVPDKLMNVTTWPDVLGTEAVIRTHWLASHSDVIISHYIVKYTLDGVEMNTTSTSEETVQVVKRGTLYRVAVAAVSVIGIGNFSDLAQGKSYNGGWVKIIGGMWLLSFYLKCVCMHGFESSVFLHIDHCCFTILTLVPTYMSIQHIYVHIILLLCMYS